MGECACGLPLEPPAGVKHWHPTLDSPPRAVTAVARYGQDPNLRRAVRTPGSNHWAEEGHLVNFYQDKTPPLSWDETGTCWAGTKHPVVPVAE